MAKFANDKSTVEEEPKPPYKLNVNFTGWQNLSLTAYNINDANKQLSDLSKQLKCMGLEIEYDDQTFDWIAGQSPPDAFFDESKEAPKEEPLECGKVEKDFLEDIKKCKTDKELLEVLDDTVEHYI